MQQCAQKPEQKFCRSKENKNSETHPKSSEKGETGCVLGAGEGCSRCGRVKKPGIRTKVNPKTILHMKKENRQKRSVSAGFWQGQKDSNPRHAVLEWMWGERTRKQKTDAVDRFFQASPEKLVLVWC